MKTNFDIGIRIREIRQQRSFSQEQLALQAGITTAYLGMVERGEKNPTVAIIERICDASCITLADFFASHIKEDTSLDEISRQILHQLDNKSDGEKRIVLQIIKQMFKLQQMGTSQ